MTISVVLLRVWVPDRPGALGAVASRVGAVGGDVIGIDILERGAGRAIDELWVELTSTDQIPLLIAEVGEVDGVDVEDCRVVNTPRRSPALFSFQGALGLLEESDPAVITQRLADLAVDVCAAEGGVVIHRTSGTSDETSDVVYSGIEPAEAQWLVAFARGIAAQTATDIDVSAFPDLAVGVLARSGLLLAVSRRGLTLRAKERDIVSALAAAADHRLVELG